MNELEKPADQPIQIVWFKRDLRIQDHLALSQAAAQGAVVPLYVVENEYWRLPDASARQWEFVAESLQELRAELAKIGQPLIIRKGDVISVLEKFAQMRPIAALWSHEETGNNWTFQRDKKVAAWCRLNSVPWFQIQQNGTQRRIKSRDGWAKQWEKTMAAPLVRPKSLMPLSFLYLGDIPDTNDIGIQPDDCPGRQHGGRTKAEKQLATFLANRGEHYRSEMSSPLTAATSCSRLSPYLAWGVLSMREVAQATWCRQHELRQQKNPTTTKWKRSLASFSGRLHWHCHFIQKLEDEPRLEYENLHPAYNGLRPHKPNGAFLTAWENGETGLPFVDACMRFLRSNGWLNFRMRAMLTAVASYHLWLDWRKPGQHLARCFTDYEPGIHWPQIQMQSGTTGINTPRIYNPVKQGYDQDPHGIFVRTWVPELSSIDPRYLQEPWKAENAATILDKFYPYPIVDHLAVAKKARQKIWAVRKSNEFRDDAKKNSNQTWQS